jgi:hypothetical protein
MDTFLVRTLLVPSTVVLLGRWNWWPSRMSRASGQIRDAEPRATPAGAAPAAAAPAGAAPAAAAPATDTPAAEPRQPDPLH